jgi:hypothetical protein
MRRLELYPFRYRDRLTGKWVKARYVASREDIAARYAEWEIIGPPEIRDVDPKARYFTPWKVIPHAELVRMHEPAPRLNPQLDRPPSVDAQGCFLTSLFLRRYITYCARQGRYAQMQGAARLYRDVAAADEAVA